MIKMINTIKKHLIVLIITALPLLSLAQGTIVASAADSTSIKAQFDKVYKKSNTYEQNKVVSIRDYNSLRQNATDSIRSYKKEATGRLLENSGLSNKLETSNAEITQLKQELTTAQNTQNSVSLLGIEVAKKSYNIIMWGIIFCLAILSTILFLMFQRGHQLVIEASTRLKEVQDDLVKLRKNGIEREQKLGHELQSYKLNHK
jgi:hypothetical protein